MKRRYVLVNCTGEFNSRADFMQCIGIYDRFEDAVTEIMFKIKEDADGRKDSDKTEISPMFELEGETGFGFDVKHEYEEQYLILFYDDGTIEHGEGKSETD